MIQKVSRFIRTAAVLLTPVVACVAGLPLPGSPCPCPAGYCCQKGEVDQCIIGEQCTSLPAPGTEVDGGIDAVRDDTPEVPASPDAEADGGTEVAGGGDAGQETRPLLPFIYVATGSAQTNYVADQLIIIDVAAGLTFRDLDLSGTVAIAYRNDLLLVARGGGNGRITALDPSTLALAGTTILPWDFNAAVFSADGRYAYVAHGDGNVAQIRLSDGVEAASLKISHQSSDPVGITGLALDRTDTYLGATSFDGGTSLVTLIRIDGETLRVEQQWAPQPFADCERIVAGPIFSRSSSHLVTFDNNCEAFDIYDLMSGLWSTMGSVRLTRSDGSSPYTTTVEDSIGQFWATNFDSLFRTSLTDQSRQGSFLLGFEPGLLLTDSIGETMYEIPNDPRSHGILKINPSTGDATRMDWNLDLFSFGAAVVTTTYVVR